MKYIVLVADGMADYPIAELDGKTPLEVSRKPNMDFLAKNGAVGTVQTVPDNMPPASDVANISILGYNPAEYYTGRAPLEAANLGITLADDEIALRCNLITVSTDQIIDYSAGHIKSKEAEILIAALNKSLGSELIKFYPGISYRHITVIKGPLSSGMEKLSCKAPHDIMGQNITKNFPKGAGSDTLIKLMEDSRKVLSEHEINTVRLDLKENPANMIWLWGQGKKPSMPSFKERFGLSGSVISAVDLIKGLGKTLGLDVINVPGATGYYDTNYEGKAEAAVNSLKNHDFVFVHLEAPDEAGHNGDLREKILAIERFDKHIVGKFIELAKNKENVRILILPDHATPISKRTHTGEPVCFLVYGNNVTSDTTENFSEKNAGQSGMFFKSGYELMNFFIHQK